MFLRNFKAMAKKLDSQAVKRLLKSVDNYMFDCDGEYYIIIFVTERISVTDG